MLYRYTGLLCDTLLNDCDGNRCANFAPCVDTVPYDGAYGCSCLNATDTSAAYTGLFCELHIEQVIHVNTTSAVLTRALPKFFNIYVAGLITFINLDKSNCTITADALYVSCGFGFAGCVTDANCSFFSNTTIYDNTSLGLDLLLDGSSIFTPNQSYDQAHRYTALRSGSEFYSNPHVLKFFVPTKQVNTSGGLIALVPVANISVLTSSVVVTIEAVQLVCPSTQECANGATCVRVSVASSAYNCICLPGYSGIFCETVIPLPVSDPCMPNPCINSGNCEGVGTNFTCKCMSGYLGAKCEIPPPPDPTEDQVLSFRRRTVDGQLWTPRTGGACNVAPCLNGGVCKDNISHAVGENIPSGEFVCACGSHATGVRCEILIDSWNQFSLAANVRTFSGACKTTAPGGQLLWQNIFSDTNTSNPGVALSDNAFRMQRAFLQTQLNLANKNETCVRLDAAWSVLIAAKLRNVVNLTLQLQNASDNIVHATSVVNTVNDSIATLSLLNRSSAVNATLAAYALKLTISKGEVLVAIAMWNKLVVQVNKENDTLTRYEQSRTAVQLNCTAFFKSCLQTLADLAQWMALNATTDLLMAQGKCLSSFDQNVCGNTGVLVLPAPTPTTTTTTTTTTTPPPPSPYPSPPPPAIHACAFSGACNLSDTTWLDSRDLSVHVAADKYLTLVHSGASVFGGSSYVHSFGWSTVSFSFNGTFNEITDFTFVDTAGSSFFLSAMVSDCSKISFTNGISWVRAPPVYNSTQVYNIPANFLSECLFFGNCSSVLDGIAQAMVKKNLDLARLDLFYAINSIIPWEMSYTVSSGVWATVSLPDVAPTPAPTPAPTSAIPPGGSICPAGTYEFNFCSLGGYCDCYLSCPGMVGDCVGDNGGGYCGPGGCCSGSGGCNVCGCGVYRCNATTLVDCRALPSPPPPSPLMRYYRKIVTGQPRSVDISWSAQDMGRLWLNGVVLFDTFWNRTDLTRGYCTDGNTPLQNVFMYGAYIGPEILVIKAVKMGDDIVYMVYHDVYTKMVAWPSNTPKYYIGHTTAFDAAQWDSYTLAPAGVYLLDFSRSNPSLTGCCNTVLDCLSVSHQHHFSLSTLNLAKFLVSNNTLIWEIQRNQNNTDPVSTVSFYASIRLNRVNTLKCVNSYCTNAARDVPTCYGSNTQCIVNDCFTDADCAKYDQLTAPRYAEKSVLSSGFVCTYLLEKIGTSRPVLPLPTVYLDFEGSTSNFVASTSASYNATLSDNGLHGFPLGFFPSFTDVAVGGQALDMSRNDRGYGVPWACTDYTCPTYQITPAVFNFYVNTVTMWVKIPRRRYADFQIIYSFGKSDPSRGFGIRMMFEVVVDPANGLYVDALDVDSTHMFQSTQIGLNDWMDQWFHLALVMAPNRDFSIYFNAILMQTTANFPLQIANADWLSFGFQVGWYYGVDGRVWPFSGLIDDFKIYSELALTPTQLLQEYALRWIHPACLAAVNPPASTNITYLQAQLNERTQEGDIVMAQTDAFNSTFYQFTLPPALIISPTLRQVLIARNCSKQNEGYAANAAMRSMYAARDAYLTLHAEQLSSPDFFSSSPCTLGRNIFVGSLDRYVYSFNQTGGQRWRYPTKDMVRSSPAVDILANMLYIGSLDGYVYALDTDSGVMQWLFLTNASVISSPALVHTYTYGSKNQSYLYVGSGDGKLYCLNATSGAFIWAFATDAAVHGSPTVDGALVYIGSDDYSIYALDSDSGAMVWSYTTKGAVRGTPAVFESFLFVGSLDGYMYAIDKNSGECIYIYICIYIIYIHGLRGGGGGGGLN